MREVKVGYGKGAEIERKGRRGKVIKRRKEKSDRIKDGQGVCRRREEREE